MRPWLGTFVEIRAGGADASGLTSAVNQAFQNIARVHALMSFHTVTSDISRLNRAAWRRAVAVDPWTIQVLRDALQVAARSRGLFDPTVADALVTSGFLPEVVGVPKAQRTGRWSDIEVNDNGQVRFHRPLLIDLGGIAKGYAVDQAVAALISSGVEWGSVNAGGDLRVFGAVEQVIQVRDPRDPRLSAGAIRVRDAAVATSAPYFSLRRVGGRRLSPLVDPRNGRSCTRRVSVTVQAPACVYADALTKVVLADPTRATKILRAFSATAVVIGGAPRSWSLARPDEVARPMSDAVLR